MIKRILIIFITFLIAISGFLTGFYSVGVISVYADVVDDDILWQPLESENELVEAFQYYCKSRDVTIEGSIADAVTTATTGSFNGICNTLGIDITALQADIKKSTDNNGNLQFLFNETGIAAYNRIFAQFLQDNEIEVGDTDVEVVLKSGLFFKDLSGNACWVYKTTSGAVNFTSSNFIVQQGTTYRYTGVDINSMIPNTNRESASINFNFKYYNGSNDVTGYTRTFYRNSYSGRNYIDTFVGSWNGNSPKIYGNNGSTTYNSDLVIFVTSGAAESNVRRLNLGYISYCSDGTKGISTLLTNIYVNQEDVSQNLTDIDILIISNQVNNNTYEGDTIINNEGDIINNNPTQPNNPNDTIHNVPQTPLTPNDDGGWDIDLPDIDIPNLPIGNLSEKFPFSIPWDLVAFYAMLDAEPQAPRFNGTMDLTLIQWNYDIDLSPFDSAAELCRKLQFGLFVVGLIVASRSIIRG